MVRVILLFLVHCMVILPQVRFQELFRHPVTGYSPLCYNSQQTISPDTQVYIMDKITQDSSEVPSDSLYGLWDTINSVYNRVFTGLGAGLYVGKDETEKLNLWYIIDLPFGFRVEPFSFYAMLRVMRRPEDPEADPDDPETPMIYEVSYLLGASARIDISDGFSVLPVLQKAIRKGKSNDYNLGLQLREGNQLGGFFADYYYSLLSFDDYVSIGMVVPMSVLFMLW